MIIYLAVTPDRMELPIAFGNSRMELSRIMGLDHTTICNKYKSALKIPIGRESGHAEKYRVRAVEIGDDDDD